MAVFPLTPCKHPVVRIRMIQRLIFHQGILGSLLASSSGQVLALSCSAQSSGSSSQASLCANGTARSGATRALILLSTPRTSTKCESRGLRVFQTLLAHQDLIWVPASTLSSHSCLRAATPPVRLTTHRHPDQRHLIRTLNPKAVAVVRDQPPTSTLSITMLEAHLSRSLLAALALQNSRPHISVDLKINLRPSRIPPAPLLPAPPTLLTGDRGPVLPLVNLSPELSPEPSNRLISCKIWVGDLVLQGFI